MHTYEITIEISIYTKQGDRDDAQENIYLIENHCQTNSSQGRRGKALILFFMNEIKLYYVYISL